MAMTTALPDFLIADADGFIRVSGHRIGYHHVVARFNEGCSAEMLWEEFPTLPLATIYKLIAFHLEDPSASNAYVAQCHEDVRQQADSPSMTPNLAELRQRLIAKRSAGVS
ncbi:MAG: DUF433 domain-containing protein [Planctomycetota bacterium]